MPPRYVFLEMVMKNAVPILMTVFFMVVSQIMTKLFAVRHPTPDAMTFSNWKQWFIGMFFVPYAWILGVTLVLASLCWFALLKRMELSVAYALVISLTIMANLTGSVLVLKESFTPNKIAACVLVAAGLVVMSR